MIPGKTSHQHNLIYSTHIINNIDHDILKYLNYNSNNDMCEVINGNTWYVDSLANMAFTGNIDLILNVVNTNIRVETVGGIVMIKKKGYLPFIGEVYYNQGCLMNGIGLCLLTSACGGDWYLNEKDGWVFNLTKNNKSFKLIFKLDKIGFGCVIDKHTINILHDLENKNNNFALSSKITSNSNSVVENEKLYNISQKNRARLAIDTWSALGHISEGWLKKLSRTGAISNLPYNIIDINNAVDIYGRPTYNTKGTMKFRKINIKNQTLDMPTEPQIIYSDVMYWRNKAFLLSIAKPLYLLTIYNIHINYTSVDIEFGWKGIIKMLNAYQYVVKKIVCDSDAKFISIKDSWNVGVPIDPVGAYQHNVNCETEVRLEKERMRCITEAVPWHIPDMLINSLAAVAVLIHNILPRVDQITGARQKLTGEYVDYNQIKYAWGQYAQGYVRSNQINNDNTRSTGVILLVPKLNESGSYSALNLNTRRFVTVSQIVPAPTTQAVIDYMNNWYYEEKSEQSMTLNKTNEKLLNKKTNKKKIKEKEIFNVSRTEETVQTQMDTEQTNQQKETDINLEEHTSDQRTVIVDDDDDGRNDGISEDNVVKESIQPHKSMINQEFIHGEDVLPLLIDDSDDEDDKDGDYKEYETYGGDRYPKRYRRPANKFHNYSILLNADDKCSATENYEERDNNSYNKPHNYNVWQYAHICIETYDEHNIEDLKFMFLSKIKAALIEGGTAVENAIRKEFQQLINKPVWEYQSLKNHPTINSFKELLPRPISSLLNVDKKFDAAGVLIKWKARFCACGNHQDKGMYEEDLSSPTMTLESVFIILVFAAQWNSDVVTADITGAFLESILPTNDIVYMYLSRDAVDELKKIDPSIYEYILEDGRVLVKLLRALYGTIQAAMLWYKLLRKIILEYGFIQHVNDRCVFILKRKGVVFIVGFHVDDLLMVCKDKNLISHFIAYLLGKFTNVTVHEGKEQTYLGMMIKMEEDGVISVSMDGYVASVLDMYNLPIDVKVNDPQSDDIFNIDKNSINLDESRRKKFHSVVYMLVYLGKRVRVEIQMALSFLAGRVSKATEQDEKKLFRVLIFLRNYPCEKLYFRKQSDQENDSLSNMDVKIWADSSWACHDDGTSRSSIILTVNNTVVSAFTHKQKLVTLHSTEAELVCLTDSVRYGLWTRNFVEFIVRIHNDSEEIIIMKLMQDNMSVIKLQDLGQRNKQRTRHLTIRLWWAQEQVELGIARIIWVCSEEMLADFLTKALHGKAFIYCWRNVTNTLID
jgi:hypothetical protein